MPACTSSPTAAGCRARSRARWPGASTSSSCATRTRPTTSCWPPPRPRARSARPPALFLLGDRPDLAAASPDGVRRPDDVRRPRASSSAATPSSGSAHWSGPGGIRRTRGLHRGRPVHATPTKEGRPAIGIEPIGHAAAHVSVPWFAIGGLDASNVGAVVRRARRIVVRALAQATTPRRRRNAARRHERPRGWAQPAAPQRRSSAHGAAARGCSSGSHAPRLRAPRSRNAVVRAQLSRSPGGPAPLVIAAARRAARSPTSPRGRRLTSMERSPGLRSVALRRAHAGRRLGMWDRRCWAVLSFEALSRSLASPRCRCSSPPT